jgi:hypothetical protein
MFRIVKILSNLTCRPETCEVYFMEQDKFLTDICHTWWLFLLRFQWPLYFTNCWLTAYTFNDAGFDGLESKELSKLLQSEVIYLHTCHTKCVPRNELNWKWNCHETQDWKAPSWSYTRECGDDFIITQNHFVDWRSNVYYQSLKFCSFSRYEFGFLHIFCCFRFLFDPTLFADYNSIIFITTSTNIEYTHTQNICP